MAEQQSSYEFAPVEAKDILAERTSSWEGFTQFTFWGIVAVVAILLALLVLVVF